MNGSYIQVIPVNTITTTNHPMAGYESIAEGFTSGDVVMEIWVEEGAEIPAGFRAV